MATCLEPVTKVSDELKALLNDAVAREIQVSVQYMWQHVEVSGVKAVAVGDRFKMTAISEMKHAEKIAERLWTWRHSNHQGRPHHRGREPQGIPRVRHQGRGGSREDVPQDHQVGHRGGDVTTAFIFKGTLEDEEEHHDLLPRCSRKLEDRRIPSDKRNP